jgi:DedD protein
MTAADMPSDPTAEQDEIRRKGRQRLIGAVVLALIVVVFVPMLLDPEPRRERVAPLLAIPPKDGAPPLVAPPKGTGPAPRPESAKAASAETVAADSAAGVVPVEPPVARRAVEAGAEESMPPAAGAAATKTQVKPALPAQKLQGFAVQVGAFKDETKLAQAREKIAAARLVHYTERLDGASGELTRLRAGPFPSREAAEKAAVRLKQAGLDGQVVVLP